MDHHDDHDAHATDDLHAFDETLGAGAPGRRELAGPESAIEAAVPGSAPFPPPATHDVPSAWTRGEIAGIAVAAVSGAAIVLTILVPRMGPRAEPASVPVTTTPAALSTPAPGPPAARPAPLAAPAGWQRASEWVGRRRQSVAFELEADRAVRAWMRQVRPVLVVRCLGGSLDAFMVTGTPSRIEPGRSDHSVRLTFDEEPAVVEHWADSAEHDGLFAPDSAAFLDRLSRARTLRVAFTPHNAPEAEASFAVTGADALVGPLQKHCRQR